MSVMSISKSYAALAGIEGYMKGKSAAKDTKESIRKLVDPERRSSKNTPDDKGAAGAIEKPGGQGGLVKRLTGKLHLG